MHLRIHLDHQKLFFKKRYFWPFGVVKNVFWCIFEYFQTTRIMSLQKICFNIWNCLKTCFHAFAHTSRPSETFFQKRYFWTSGVVKDLFWCICTYFQTTRNYFQKRYFLPSGVFKDVFWCICAYFQTTRIMFLKKIFFNVRSG